VDASGTTNVVGCDNRVPAGRARRLERRLPALSEERPADRAIWLYGSRRPDMLAAPVGG